MEARIESSIYAVQEYIARKAVEYYRNIAYGYEYVPSKDQEILSLYKKVLRRYVLTEDSCLCSKNVQLILENITERVGVREVFHTSSHLFAHSRKNLSVDKCGLNNWIIQNPYAVPREKWEKVAYEVLDEIGFDVDKYEISCDITYDLVTNKLNPKVLIYLRLYKLSCLLGASLSVKKYKTKPKPRISRNPRICVIDSEVENKVRNCKTTVDLESIEKECTITNSYNNDNIDCDFYYKKLVEEVECDLDYTTYSKLIDCNISPEMIKTFYKAGIKLVYSSEEHAPLMVLDSGTYPLDCFAQNLTIEDIQKILSNPESTEYADFIENPGKYYIDLGSDYDLEDDLLSKL